MGGQGQGASREVYGPHAQGGVTGHAWECSLPEFRWVGFQQDFPHGFTPQGAWLLGEKKDGV